MKVLLGPSHELHVGIHGSLLESPPPATEYVQCTYVLRFLHDRRSSAPFSPLHDPALGEWARFDDVPSDVSVIHAVRVPVETTLPWVVDADSLLVPLQIGRFLALGSAARGEQPTLDQASVRRRERSMVAHYRSQHCRRILLRTELARRELLQHLEARGYDQATIDTFAAKAEVVYPAVTGIAEAASRQQRVTVLYMGRTPRDKGAALATSVFTRLREVCGQAYRAMFLGPCPTELTTPLTAADVELYPIMPRRDYLNLLAQSDIFFSPTAYESVGMALVEAAAAGAAIVCSCGPGMEHVPELFTDRKNALFVSNDLATPNRVAAYTEAIAGLIHNPSLRRRLQQNNRELTTHGKLSVKRRDELLTAAYATAAAEGPCADNASPPWATPRSRRYVSDWPEQLCHWSGRRYTAMVGGRVSVSPRSAPEQLEL
jgi:glycosyltransferase involved in cell wall biosynthesis